jgi:hypothetical protein
MQLPPSLFSVPEQKMKRVSTRIYRLEMELFINCK